MTPFCLNVFSGMRDNDLAHLNRATPFAMLPTNATKFRTSAHYMEINHRYFVGMLGIYKNEYEKIRVEREQLSRKEKLTKFNKDYKYVEFKQG